jgi:hypothetical protein
MGCPEKQERVKERALCPANAGRHYVATGASPWFKNEKIMPSPRRAATLQDRGRKSAALEALLCFYQSVMGSRP